MQRIARALGMDDAASGLFDLAEGLGVSMSLRTLGMPDNSIESVVEQATANPYWNPRPLEKDALTALIGRAFRGDAPAFS
jgi:alcohol dehydrogenase class IV